MVNKQRKNTFASIDDEMIQRAPLAGSDYINDNKSLWQLLWYTVWQRRGNQGLNYQLRSTYL